MRTRRPFPRSASMAVAVVALVLGGLVAGCSSSSSKGTTSTVGPANTLKGATGYTCKDPTGDIALGQSGPSNLSQPAGIDIVEASAHVQGDVLAVSFTTAAPISSAATPLFAVDSGDPSAAPQTSFELRAEQKSASAPWQVNLHTFKGPKEAIQDLSIPVTVNGNTLSYEVPLRQIPPVVSIQWQFGSTSTAANGDVFFDSCDSFSSSSTTSSAG
jgi:hypothetical protein